MRINCSCQQEALVFRCTQVNRCRNSLKPHFIANGNSGFSRFSDNSANVQVDSCYSCAIPTKMNFMLDRVELHRLNDIDFNAAYCTAVQKVMEDPQFRTVIDISQGLSLLGLQALKVGASEVCCLESRPSNQDLIRFVAAANSLPVDSVTFAERNFEEWEGAWDILTTELVDSYGCLGQQVLEDIALARCVQGFPCLRVFTFENNYLFSNGVNREYRGCCCGCRATCLKPDSIVIPHEAKLYAMLIESDSLQADSALVDDERTCDFQIARHINDFQVHPAERLHAIPLPTFSSVFEMESP